MPYIEKDLGKFGYKKYSQNNEDGIIRYLVEVLSISAGYFVEFGVGPPWKKTFESDGLEANCRLLRESGWEGLFMDGGSYPPEADIKKEFITALNINTLLEKYGVPENFDILSIDVDGQDFWIWMALMKRPKIVIVEYNSDFNHETSVSIPFNANYHWDCSSYYGASLAAFDKLAMGKGYTLVYANGVNAFFVDRTLVDNAEDFKLADIIVVRERHTPDQSNRPWLPI